MFPLGRSAFLFVAAYRLASYFLSLSLLLLHSRYRLSAESAGAQALPLEGLWLSLSSPPSAQASLPVICVMHVAPACLDTDVAIVPK